MTARVLAIILMAIAATFAYGDAPMPKNDSHRVCFRFTDGEIIVATVDNSAVRSLVAMLPLTLEFRDYAGIEKISDLPRRLDLSDVPDGCDPSVDDLTLYEPWGNLAFSYRDHGYARGLVPLGSIVSGEEFLGELDGADAVLVEVAD